MKTQLSWPRDTVRRAPRAAGGSADRPCARVRCRFKSSEAMSLAKLMQKTGACEVESSPNKNLATKLFRIPGTTGSPRKPSSAIEPGDASSDSPRRMDARDWPPALSPAAARGATGRGATGFGVRVGQAGSGSGSESPASASEALSSELPPFSEEFPRTEDLEREHSARARAAEQAAAARAGAAWAPAAAEARHAGQPGSFPTDKVSSLLLPHAHAHLPPVPRAASPAAASPRAPPT